MSSLDLSNPMTKVTLWFPCQRILSDEEEQERHDIQQFANPEEIKELSHESSVNEVEVMLVVDQADEDEESPSPTNRFHQKIPKAWNVLAEGLSDFYKEPELTPGGPGSSKRESKRSSQAIS